MSICKKYNYIKVFKSTSLQIVAYKKKVHENHKEQGTDLKIFLQFLQSQSQKSKSTGQIFYKKIFTPDKKTWQPVNFFLKIKLRPEQSHQKINKSKFFQRKIKDLEKIIFASYKFLQVSISKKMSQSQTQIFKIKCKQLLLQ